MTNSLLTYRATLNLCRSLFLLIDDFLILRELIFAIVKEWFFPVLQSINLRFLRMNW